MEPFKKFCFQIELPTNYYDSNALLDILNTQCWGRATADASVLNGLSYSTFVDGVQYTNHLYLGFVPNGGSTEGDLFVLQEGTNNITFQFPGSLTEDTTFTPGSSVIPPNNCYQKYFTTDIDADPYVYVGTYFVEDDETIGFLEMVGFTYDVAPSILHTNYKGFGFTYNTSLQVNAGKTNSWVSACQANSTLANSKFSSSTSNLFYPQDYTPSTTYNATYAYNLRPINAMLCCVDFEIPSTISNDKTSQYHIIGIIHLNQATFGDAISYEEYFPTSLKTPPMINRSSMEITYRTLTGDIINFEGISWLLTLVITSKETSKSILDDTIAIQNNQKDYPIYYNIQEKTPRDQNMEKQEGYNHLHSRYHKRPKF